MSISASKAEILDLLNALGEPDLREALEYVRELVAESEQHSVDEGESDNRGGIRHGRPTSEDDPLWRIVGLASSDHNGPTDVAANKHTYLAEAYADRHEG